MDYNTVALIAHIFMVIIVIVSWWLLGTTLDSNPIQSFKLSDLDALLDLHPAPNHPPDIFIIPELGLGPTLCQYFGSIGWAYSCGKPARFEMVKGHNKIVDALPKRVEYDPEVHRVLNQNPNLTRVIGCPLAHQSEWVANRGLFNSIQSLIQRTFETTIPKTPRLSPDIIIHLEYFEPVIGSKSLVFQSAPWYNYALVEAARYLNRSLGDLRVLVLTSAEAGGALDKMLDDLLPQLITRNIIVAKADETEQLALMYAVPALISNGGILAYMAAWGNTNLMITPDLLNGCNTHFRDHWIVLPSNPTDQRDVSNDAEILMVAEKLRNHLKRRQSTILGSLT
jgi:hypothetical protein